LALAPIGKGEGAMHSSATASLVLLTRPSACSRAPSPSLQSFGNAPGTKSVLCPFAFLPKSEVKAKRKRTKLSEKSIEVREVKAQCVMEPDGLAFSPHHYM